MLARVVTAGGCLVAVATLGGCAGDRVLPAGPVAPASTAVAPIPSAVPATPSTALPAAAATTSPPLRPSSPPPARAIGAGSGRPAAAPSPNGPPVDIAIRFVGQCVLRGAPVTDPEGKTRVVVFGYRVTWTPEYSLGPSFLVELSGPGDPTFRGSFSTLGGGYADRQYVHRFQQTQVGQEIRMRLVADPDNYIHEVNERNNEATLVFTVSAAQAVLPVVEDEVPVPCRALPA